MSLLHSWKLLLDCVHEFPHGNFLHSRFFEIFFCNSFQIVDFLGSELFHDDLFQTARWPQSVEPGLQGLRRQWRRRH